MDLQPRDTACPGFAWLNTLLVISFELNAELKSRFSLNVTQASALVYLGVEGQPVRIGDISRRLFLRPNTTTAAVKALEESGLIYRSSSPSDKRGVFVSLTGLGTSIYEETRDVLTDYFSTNADSIQALVEGMRSEDDAPSPGNAMYCSLFLEIRHYIVYVTDYSHTLDLNLSSLRILAYLRLADKKLKLVEISRALSLRQNMLSLCVSSLSSAGLIRRRVNSSDKRSSIISTSAAGKNIADNIITFLYNASEESVLPLNTLPPEA